MCIRNTLSGASQTPPIHLRSASDSILSQLWVYAYFSSRTFIPTAARSSADFIKKQKIFTFFWPVYFFVLNLHPNTNSAYSVFKGLNNPENRKLHT